eukprot:3752304-Alexandrium_andersonii.AAC.1
MACTWPRKVQLMTRLHGPPCKPRPSLVWHTYAPMACTQPDMNMPVRCQGMFVSSLVHDRWLCASTPQS